MGVAGAYIAKGAIFVAAAALCIPALIALNSIRSDEIDYARARNAKSTKQLGAKGSASKQAGGKPAVTATSILTLAKNRELVLYRDRSVSACRHLYAAHDGRKSRHDARRSRRHLDVGPDRSSAGGGRNFWRPG